VILQFHVLDAAVVRRSENRFATVDDDEDKDKDALDAFAEHVRNNLPRLLVDHVDVVAVGSMLVLCDNQAANSYDDAQPMVHDSSQITLRGGIVRTVAETLESVCAALAYCARADASTVEELPGDWEQPLLVERFTGGRRQKLAGGQR